MNGSRDAFSAAPARAWDGPPLAEAQLEPGRPWPLGAHWDGQGVNFAVFSAHAQAMDLCLFDAHGVRQLARLRLPAHDGEVWHGYLRGAGPGLVYGLRAHGPWAPEAGHRFDPYKLLLDPYAREIVGHFEWRSEHFTADRRHSHFMDQRDNAAFALKACVVDPHYDWDGDTRLHTPWERSVLYECHVKGFTRLHPGVPEALRGTYAGLASDAAVAHLQHLGVTAVSLLPVQQRLDEQRLVALGLTNHWGYNTVGFFAAEPRLASGALGLSARDEFRAMVRRLHAAGIEVILDVVYNHTAETDEHGPTISWRGLDNASYYRLEPGRPGRYENLSGCGNTLDIRRPRVLQMVLDSLRYWVHEMHVDGFRFDLATVLGRSSAGFDAHAAFFQALAQDPQLAGVKLIAEPWDIGPGGYQLGQFPRGWHEWNDRFRDAARGFWLGGSVPCGEFVQRLCGSSNLFQRHHRPPDESVNFIAAHDGFTLRDLVSYDHKHNSANGEHNRDGHGHNLSWNCGEEGPSTDPRVNARRTRLQRALLATLLLAQGTPMLWAGDELGHSQGGNNNAYCQDNATSWIDWSSADRGLIEFTARLVALRRELQPLANHWYTGVPDAGGLPDLSWLHADGRPLDEVEWHDPALRVLGALIGTPGRAPGPLLLLFNAADAPQPFALPGGRWQALLDTAHDGAPAAAAAPPQGAYPLSARSVALLACAPSASASPHPASP